MADASTRLVQTSARLAEEELPTRQRQQPERAMQALDSAARGGSSAPPPVHRSRSRSAKRFAGPPPPLPEGGASVRVVVSSLSGECLADLDLLLDTTIGDVKQVLRAVAGVPFLEQRLVCRESVPPDASTLRELLDTPGELRLGLVRMQRRLAMTGGLDKALRLWDAETGECLSVMQGHAAAVSGLEVDWERYRAISGDVARGFFLWDLGGGGCSARELHGHTDRIHGIAVDWDTSRAATWSSDGTLRFWDLALGACLSQMAGHSDPIADAEVDWDDPPRALSCGICGSLILWDLRSGTAVWTLRQASDKVWDLERHSLLFELDGHGVEVEGMVADWDSRVAITWALLVLLLWDLSTGACTRKLEGHRGIVCGALASDECAEALSWSTDRTLRLWQLAGPGAPQSKIFRGHTDAVGGAEVDWKSRRALSFSDDGSLLLWDLDAGSPPIHALRGHTGVVWNVDVDWETGRALSWSFVDANLRLWDLRASDNGAGRHKGGPECSGDGLKLQAVDPPDDRHGIVPWSGAVEVDWKRRRALSWHGASCEPRVWDLDKGCLLSSLRGHERPLACAALQS